MTNAAKDDAPGRRSHNFRDISGLRFGMLSVICLDRVVRGKSFWLCKCDCNNFVTAPSHGLIVGYNKSCGCYRATRGRITHGRSKTRLYGIWTGMKTRCLNARSTRYSDYGGRGISICAEWLGSYETFAAWALESGYEDHLTIDRSNNDLGYSPSNCRWITRADQNANRRMLRSQKISADDISAIIADSRSYSKIAADYGVGMQRIGKIKIAWKRAEAAAVRKGETE